MSMEPIKPKVFISYSRRDSEFVSKAAGDLAKAGIDCWMDVTTIEAGDRLKNAIFGTGIPRCNLFFAYVTRNYLESRWCMKELEEALHVSRVMVTPFADSRQTMEEIPMNLRDEVHCGIFNDDTYSNTVLELCGKAWSSLQSIQRLVSSEDHILAGPAIFDTGGFTRLELIERTTSEMILAGPNLRSWLSDPETRAALVEAVKKKPIRLKFILATYETLRPIAAEGVAHLRQSAEDIQAMRGRLNDEERSRMTAYFHVGASTLSAVFIDPEKPTGALFFNPRWAIQFLPQDRLTCVIDKRINSPALFKAVYNSVFLMTQRDASTLEEMLAKSG